ncbi:hypothetical protein HNQ36_003058 [Afipia massiliensis]|uniref:Uncharacterized protein n=1 Tax=Afipia massiliensis TaxID=211460 RepID=A0A840N3G6_9BRAD|nr:hypothetical protein [Afipia massiliensis]MBB5053067.1 hypothetical protein [Afipia massiliensis]
MHNNAPGIEELATTRRQILSSYDESQLDRLLAVEAAIITAPHATDADRQIKRDIFYENGEPDFADRFIQKLALSLC